jgi:hypothetical protein
VAQARRWSAAWRRRDADYYREMANMRDFNDPLAKARIKEYARLAETLTAEANALEAEAFAIMEGITP